MTDEEIRIEGLERLNSARHQKVIVEVLLRESYWFTAPIRSRSVLSTFKPPTAPPQDAELLSQSFAMEMAADFPTVIIDTFMPSTENWCERRAGLLVSEGEKEEIEKQAKVGDEMIFKAIRGSNFYPECAKTFNPDLSIGTVAMWIEEGKHPGTHRCQGVPIRELEIDLGADGEIDYRAMVRWTKFQHIDKLLKGMDVSGPARAYIDKEKAKDKRADCCFIRAFWREDDDDTKEVCWRYVVMLDDRLVTTKLLRGRGSCPLIVGRFGASPEWAWAEGQIVKALPDLRTLDELSRKKILSIDIHLMPPIAYPDDSISHLEDGLEAGRAYPMRPGSEAAIKNIYDPPPPDPAIYAMEELKTGIKRLMYLDWPTQSGDTPPTATQWVDEMTMAQRRIGPPGILFWREFPAEVFVRFEHLLERQGIIRPLTTKQGSRISLMPYNPAERAADQQDVAQFTKFVQIAGMAFPEEFKIASDGTKTLAELADIMAVEHIWKPRDPKQVAAAVQQIAQLKGGATPGAPDAAAGQNATEAIPQNLGGQDQPQGQFMFQSRNSGNTQGG